MSFSSNNEFYLHTLEGEILLVEVFEFNGGVSIKVGNDRRDLDAGSAFDLADAIMQIINEIEDG